MNDKKFQAAVRTFERLARELSKEHEAWSRRLKPRSQILRRAYIRALFAFVDGTLFGSKQFLLKVHQFLDAGVGTGDTALLREEGYGLDRQGEVQVRAQYLSTPENVRFTFRMLYRVFRKLPLANFGGKGWAAFREAVAIRNRITHPKRVVDFSVSPKDIKTVEDGVTWYRDSLARQSYGLLSGIRGDAWLKKSTAEHLARVGRRPTRA